MLDPAGPRRSRARTARAAEREAERRDAVRSHVGARPGALRAQPELRVLEHRPRGEGQSGGACSQSTGAAFDNGFEHSGLLYAYKLLDA